MIQDKIQIPKELAERFANDKMSILDFKDVADEMINIIRAQISGSEQSLRLTVLTQEYVPKDGEWTYPVDTRTGAQYEPERFSELREYFYQAFAPTPELAQELSDVIRGEWHPKIGDEYCSCGKELRHSWNNENTTKNVWNNYDESIRRTTPYNYHQFPSIKQMLTFIQSHQDAEKPELRPICDGCGWITPNLCENESCEYYKRRSVHPEFRDAEKPKEETEKLSELYSRISDPFKRVEFLKRLDAIEVASRLRTQ